MIKTMRWLSLKLAWLVMWLGVGCAGRSVAPPPPTGLELLTAIEEVLSTMVEQARPAVVSVIARDVQRVGRIAPEEEPIIPRVDGTGFLYSPDGYIYTCDHVVHEAERVDVRLIDGRTFEAQIVGSDTNTDIAVLKVKTAEPLPFLKLADSSQVRPGQFVVAIGHPFYLDFSTTIGIVSATGRTLQDKPGYSLRGHDRIIRYEDFIQTDAWINRGSSGGPLLNIRGEVVGMNSMIRAARDQLNSGPGFAIASSLLTEIGEQLLAHGRVARGWLGIRMQSDQRGIRVLSVRTGTPADQAGLRSGDIILKYNGQDIPDKRWFQHAVAMTRVGTSVPLTVLRANRVEVLNVVITEMPPQYSGRSPLSAGSQPIRSKTSP